MNPAKAVQILLVVVLVLFALSVAVGVRGGREDEIDADAFEPPPWMTQLDRLTAPFSARLDREEVRLPDGSVLPEAGVRVTQRTVLTIRPAEPRARRASFAVSGAPARITYEPAPPASGDEDEERVTQRWPDDRRSESPAVFSIFQEGGTIEILPQQPDTVTTVTLD